MRTFNIGKVLETGAGETSILFRSLEVETYSLECQPGPWSDRAAEYGCKWLFVPFDYERRLFAEPDIGNQFAAHGLSDIDLLFIDAPIGTPNRQNILGQLMKYVKPRFVLYHDALRDSVNLFRDQARYGLRLVHFFDSPRGLALFEVPPYECPRPPIDAFDPTIMLLQPRASIVVIEPRSVAVAPGQQFSVRIALKNTTNAPLSSRYAQPVLISYHWLSPDGTIIIWDGLRSKLPFDLGPADTAEFLADVMGPEREGKYLLQLAVVQEDVAWFETAEPKSSAEALVSVQQC